VGAPPYLAPHAAVHELPGRLAGLHEKKPLAGLLGLDEHTASSRACRWQAGQCWCHIQCFLVCYWKFFAETRRRTVALTEMQGTCCSQRRCMCYILIDRAHRMMSCMF
jgi:hypothetical protein